MPQSRDADPRSAARRRADLRACGMAAQPARRRSRATRCRAWSCWKDRTSTSRRGGQVHASRLRGADAGRPDAQGAGARSRRAGHLREDIWPNCHAARREARTPAARAAARALGDHQVADAVAKVRAIIGPANIPDSEPLAQAALDKLHKARSPSAEELTALEIVVRLLRPVVFSRDGMLDDLPDQRRPQPLSAGAQGSVERLPQLVKPLSVDRPRGDQGGQACRHRISGRRRRARDQPPRAGRPDASARRCSRPARPESSSSRRSTRRIHAARHRCHRRRRRDPSQARHGAASSPSWAGPLSTSNRCSSREATRVATIGYPAEDPAQQSAVPVRRFPGQFGVKRAAVGEVLDGTERRRCFTTARPRKAIPARRSSR